MLQLAGEPEGVSAHVPHYTQSELNVRNELCSSSNSGVPIRLQVISQPLLQALVTAAAIHKVFFYS